MEKSWTTTRTTITTTEDTIIMAPVDPSGGRVKCKMIAHVSQLIKCKRYPQQFVLIRQSNYIGRCSDNWLAEQSIVAAATAIYVLLCRYLIQLHINIWMCGRILWLGLYCAILDLVFLLFLIKCSWRYMKCFYSYIWHMHYNI